MPAALDTALGATAAATGSSTTIAQSTSAIAAANTRLILVAGQFGTQTSSSVSGGGLTWVKDFDAINASDNSRCHIWSADCPGGLASGTTITHTWAVTTDARTIAVQSFTGLATGASGYLTGTAAQIHAFGGGTPWATANITPATGGALLFVGLVADGAAGATGTVTAPATKIHDAFSATSTQEIITGYRVVTGDGSTAFSIAGTFGTAPGEDIEGIVAYKESATAATVTPSFLAIPFI